MKEGSLPTWYQISENDHGIPPDVQCTFAKQMNATTILAQRLTQDSFRKLLHESYEHLGPRSCVVQLNPS